MNTETCLPDALKMKHKTVPQEGTQEVVKGLFQNKSLEHQERC